MRLRDRLEFSKEENQEFDFLEKVFSEIEDIGFECNNGNKIEFLFPTSHEKTIREIVKELDDQRYSLKEIKILDEEKIEVVLHMRYPLKRANRVGKFLVDVWDIFWLKLRRIIFIR